MSEDLKCSHRGLRLLPADIQSRKNYLLMFLTISGNKGNDDILVTNIYLSRPGQYATAIMTPSEVIISGSGIKDALFLRMTTITKPNTPVMPKVKNPVLNYCYSMQHSTDTD